MADNRDFKIYNKIKINTKILEDAILDIATLDTTFNKGNKNYVDKRILMDALARNDLETLRDFSNYFYKASGVYQKLCNYLSTIYRYDTYLSAAIYDDSFDKEKIKKQYMEILKFIDKSHFAKMSADITLNVVKNGSYYGYIVDYGEKLILQELPLKYCRTIYNVGDLPAVEFNMRFFDEKFTNPNYRMKILKLFPKEFREGYALYKEGKLVDEAPDYRNNKSYKESGWYLLDPERSIKISFNNSTGSGNYDIPCLINSIPDIIDLDVSEGLDKRRQAQQLAKILIQKLPLDKNGDLIFDVDEAADIHANAVSMLGGTIGVDVLTTFADIEDVDLSDNSETASNAVKNAENAVYRSAGISQNLFNTEGNLSLERSILTDEGTMRNILLQLEILFNRVINFKNTKPKKYEFQLTMLETTQYNYKELAKTYKEQTQLGFSKLLPQIALGHSQSSILNAVIFENEVLQLSTVMIPPLQSSVMNAESLQTLVKGKQTESGKQQNITEDSNGGRPELAETEKSDKTLANEASKG